MYVIFSAMHTLQLNVRSSCYKCRIVRFNIGNKSWAKQKLSIKIDSFNMYGE